MKIIDLRPGWQRLILKDWERSGLLHKDAGRPGWLAQKWSGRMDSWVARRVAGRGSVPDRPRIVSIGNLALGGTGKTPVIMTLARQLGEQGIHGGILTRGYKSPLSGPLIVQSHDELAGDEARLLAAELESLNWPVVQARQRMTGLEFLEKEMPDLDLILVEDGHQTKELGRHLDVLILDRWSLATGSDGPRVVPETGAVFPFGPYRESSAGADRAEILLLETDSPVPSLGIAGQAVTTFKRSNRLEGVTEGASGLEPPSGFSVLSGIARPEAFEEAMIKLLEMEPVLGFRGQDHQEYGPSIVQKIQHQMKTAGSVGLVTTAKDWVKLQPFWPAVEPVWVAQLDIEWGQISALPQLVRERAGV